MILPASAQADVSELDMQLISIDVTVMMRYKKWQASFLQEMSFSNYISLETYITRAYPGRLTAAKAMTGYIYGGVCESQRINILLSKES